MNHMLEISYIGLTMFRKADNKIKNFTKSGNLLLKISNENSITDIKI